MFGVISIAYLPNHHRFCARPGNAGRGSAGRLTDPPLIPGLRFI